MAGSEGQQATVAQMHTLDPKELDLLLIIEEAAARHLGKLDLHTMRKSDQATVKRWAKDGFIGLSFRGDPAFPRGQSVYVYLSSEAWRLAHSERRARAETRFMGDKYAVLPIMEANQADSVDPWAIAEKYKQQVADLRKEIARFSDALARAQAVFYDELETIHSFFSVLTKEDKHGA